MVGLSEQKGILLNKAIELFFKGGLLHVNDPHPVFDNDILLADVQPYIDSLQTHSLRTMFHRLRYPAYAHIHSTYIVCTRDKVIPPFAQEAMAADTNIIIILLLAL